MQLNTSRLGEVWHSRAPRMVSSSAASFAAPPTPSQLHSPQEPITPGLNPAHGRSPTHQVLQAFVLKPAASMVTEVAFGYALLEYSIIDILYYFKILYMTYYISCFMCYICSNKQTWLKAYQLLSEHTASSEGRERTLYPKGALAKDPGLPKALHLGIVLKSYGEFCDNLRYIP